MHRLNTNSAVPVNELKRRGRKANSESSKIANDVVDEASGEASVDNLVTSDAPNDVTV